MKVLLFLASWFVWIPFLWMYPTIPWWMITPDDRRPPFGKYEPTVKKVYEKYGRFWGDFYWLCIRNKLNGLRYAQKPQKYKETADYSQYPRSVKTTWYGSKYVVDGLPLKIINLGLLEIWSGWKVRGVVQDPETVRQAVNMEFTPVFSIRKRSE